MIWKVELLRLHTHDPALNIIILWLYFQISFEVRVTFMWHSIYYSYPPRTHTGSKSETSFINHGGIHDSNLKMNLSWVNIWISSHYESNLAPIHLHKVRSSLPIFQSLEIIQQSQPFNIHHKTRWTKSEHSHTYHLQRTKPPYTHTLDSKYVLQSSAASRFQDNKLEYAI